MESNAASGQFRKADALFRARKYAEALTILDELNVQFPNTKNIMYPRALCLCCLGRTNDAKEVANHLIERFNDPRAKKFLDDLDEVTPAIAQQAPETTPCVVLDALGNIVDLDALNNLDVDLAVNLHSGNLTPLRESSGYMKGIMVGIVAVLLLGAVAAGVALMINLVPETSIQNEAVYVQTPVSSIPANRSSDNIRGPRSNATRTPAPSRASASDSTLLSAYNNRRSNIQVQGQGTVSKVLADDVSGSRHQRFILQLTTGQTLLVAHNIDLAPRIGALSIGDIVEFYGEYEWNEKGGVIHWTHHDPGGRHVGGWLRHRGRVYQ